MEMEMEVESSERRKDTALALALMRRCSERKASGGTMNDLRDLRADVDPSQKYRTQQRKIIAAVVRWRKDSQKKRRVLARGIFLFCWAARICLSCFLVWRCGFGSAIGLRKAGALMGDFETRICARRLRNSVLP